MKRWLLALIILTLTMTSFAADPWPTGKWPTSTPEEQGMNSAVLKKSISFMASQGSIEGVMVVRHGKVVMEAYFSPYRRNELHNVFSCTKSVISTLIGIAIHEGKIKDVKQKVADLLPEYPLAQKDLTLEHLLTMSTGLAWDDGSQYNQMIQSEDWVRFVLDRPIVADPGARFNYNSGASHILSAILQNATGKTAAAYADEKLFGPLGIKNYRWATDPQGRSFGGSNLYLTIPDMAKIGYLFLHHGQWNGTSIVPPKWIETATRKHIAAGNDPLGTTDYGYQWWTNGFGGYSARGFAGQYIFVMPEHDLVVSIVSDQYSMNMFAPQYALKSFILPAIQSNKPLPADPKAVQALEALIKKMAQ